MKAVNTTTFRVLDAQELQMINGGNSTNSAGMGLSSSADTLLSLEFNWQQGDMSRNYKLEVGKDIDLELNIFGTNHT